MNKGNRSCQYLALLLLLCLGLGNTAVAQPINSSAIYRNDTIGVRAAFADWEIITSRAQAPDALKPNFPENKGPNESPLFIGIHGSEGLFARLLTETWFDDLEAYSKLLSQGITGQGLELTSARLAVDNTAMELAYRHPQLDLRFLERVSLQPDSQVIRMAMWTTGTAWATSLDEIRAAFDAVELLDVINAKPGWQATWAGLGERLQGNNIAGVPLAQVSQQTTQAPSCQDPTASLLWQVESPALTANDSTIYLFGSIHVGKAAFYPLPAEIEAAFRSADYVVFEVDPTTMTDPEVIMSMQSRGMLTPGQTLADVVSDEVVADFRRVMGNMGLPAENFMSMKPWFLTLMLSSLQMNALGYMPQYGLESYFLAQKPADAQILELETIQQQIGFLENLNAETFLAYTIESFETGNEEIEALVDAWQCADKEPLTNMLFADFDSENMSAVEQADMDALMDSIYTQRNIDMAETVAGFTDEDSTYFVVVGSAHLLGEGSVVSLLRQQGYTVTPVSLSPGR